jgi:hypothetical protein
MPGPAARLADVAAFDLDPLEVRRRRQHLGQQLAVGALEALALVQRHPRVGDPFGQLVAQMLQLAQAEDPRLARQGADPVLDLHPAEAGGEEPGQLALEAPDLTAQLGAGEALVDLDVECVEALSFEQIGHRPGYKCSSRPGRASRKTVKSRRPRPSMRPSTAPPRRRSAAPPSPAPRRSPAACSRA